MRWLGLWVCMVVATGCQGWGERLTGGGEPDAGPPPLANGDPPGDGGVACGPAALPERRADVTPPAAAWGPATAVPFSCDPLPGAYFFAQPAQDAPGTYARCASFAEARATALAISPDGTRVALIGSDGIARIVDVATHTVVGVLAPPRVSIDLAAFSPAGDTILTLARGERVVTLWRADTFTPVWTTQLPGHKYTYLFPVQGALAFAPGGMTALVSAGTDAARIDVTSGATLASWTSSGDAVLGAGYGLDGQRIAVLHAPVSGDCTYGPTGGSVTILDPDTMTELATPVVWAREPGESPLPEGQLVVATGADLMLASGTSHDPRPRAFRISDGSPLPPPNIGTFPLALTPEGHLGVVATGGQIQLVGVDDGRVFTGVLASSPPTALGISADGSTIAYGSSGANLLTVWRPVSGVVSPSCSAEPAPDSPWGPGPQLSADGQTVAVTRGTEFRLLDRADGTPISTIDGSGSISLSADAAYAIVGQGLFRVSDGAQVATLARPATPSSWTQLFFTSRDAVDAIYSSADGSTLYARQDTGQWRPESQFGAPVTAAGTSGDCLVMVATVGQNVAWRACGGCSDPPFATETIGGVVSADGTVFLGQNTGEVTGATLWQVLGGGGTIRSYPPRPEEVTWSPSEFPIAVSAHGDRVITGAKRFASCGYSPGFTSRVHDVASDAVVDELPPNVTSASADLNVVAIGSVLWCAR